MDTTPTSYTISGVTPPPATLPVRPTFAVPAHLCRDLIAAFEDADPIERNLNTRVYGGDGDAGKKEGFSCDFCVICQSPFSNEEKLGILDCGHEYHANCIHSWLRRKNLCPLCNQVAVSKLERLED